MRLSSLPTTTLTILLTLAIIHSTLAVAPTVHQSSDKLSFMFEKTLKPYNHMMNAFHTGISGHLEYLNKFVSNYLSSPNSNKTSEPEQAPVKVIGLTSKNQDVPVKVTSVENVDNDEAPPMRILAAKGQTGCQNSGQLVSTRVNVYACNNTVVNEDLYNSAKSFGGCKVTTQYMNLCYCPYEFYGDQCENFNYFSCAIVQNTYNNNCTGADSFNYVYGYSGQPPCYPVGLGSSVTLVNSVSCTFNLIEKAFEGVKPAQYKVLAQPKPKAPFTYVIDSPKFKLTASNTDLRQTISFFDFNRITSPVVFTTELTSDNIAGQSTVNTTITFDSNLATYTTIGRYYYEINILANASSQGSVVVTEAYTGGFFESDGYKEPSAPFKLSSAVIGVLSALGLLIIIGLIMGYKEFQKRRFRDLIDRATFQPIINDQ